MKVLITGAHFTPAVATIEQLKKIEKVDIVYAGRKTTLEGDETPAVEKKVFQDLGIKFIGVVTGRLQRSFTIYTIPSLLKIPIGLLQALYIILSEKPNVILSFGGYVAVPIVFMGWLFSIPIIIHEQTLISGLASKISSFFADKIAVSFEKSAFKGEKVVLTGNPIRSEIIKINSKKRKDKKVPMVLIAGGNQGSHVINLAVEEVLSKLMKVAVIYHQTGDSKYQDYERLKGFESTRYKVFKFIHEDWAGILAKSDLVVSRAGINTLTELAYLGIPALVIPIPYLYQNEQVRNAEYFKSRGLVEILPQSKLTGEALFKSLKQQLNNLKALKEKASNVRKTIIPDAAKRLTLETTLLGKGLQV